MRTTTRQTLGARLAAKRRKSRRPATADAGRPRPKPSTRPRRDTADAAEARRLHRDRGCEARRLLKTIRIRNAENALEQSPIGRHLLQLTDARSKARFKEDFARIALHAAQQDAERARAEHSRVCNQLRYGEFDVVWGKLRTAETLERKAKRLHRQARESREMIDCELRTLARTAAGAN